MNPPRQSKIIFAMHMMRTVRPHPITSKLREGVKPRTSEAQENLLEMKIVQPNGSGITWTGTGRGESTETASKLVPGLLNPRLT